MTYIYTAEYLLLDYKTTLATIFAGVVSCMKE